MSGDHIHPAPTSFWRKHVFSTDHKVIAKQFMWMGFLGLFLGGVMAMMIRWQLAHPGEPFPLLGIDSDNGSEFLNAHLVRYCRSHKIQFTRGRPYKKDDNAHVEQKNWTHVRKLLGYVRYDCEAALSAINRLYRNELCWLQNLFLPSVKLLRKQRVGSKVRRYYDKPRTPLERVMECSQADPLVVARLKALRDQLDPFALSRSVDVQLERIHALANHRHSPRVDAKAVQAVS